MLPGGFPIGHSRFWSNQVFALCFACAATYGVYLVSNSKRREPGMMMAGFALFWVVASMMTRMAFPVSFAWLWWIGVAFGLVQGGLAWVMLNETPNSILKESEAFWARLAGVTGLALLLAILMPRTQSPDEPTTNPFQRRQSSSAGRRGTSAWVTETLEGPSDSRAASLVSPSEVDLSNSTQAPDSLELSDQIVIKPRQGLVEVSCEPLTLLIKPLLVFDDSSDDGFWPAFSDSSHTPEKYSLKGQDQTANRIFLSYAPSGLIEVTAARTGRIADIVGHSTIKAPVYSHLNTFCEMTVIGHTDLSCTFSPCGDQPIDILPYDNGLRLASVGSGGVFSVSQARGAEKGPWTMLTSGKVTTMDPVIITLLAAGKPVCRVTFEDWISQASTAISPTAGWKQPVNAIEFYRLSDQPDTPVKFMLTLASTSLGRGLDTVGHTAGTYRNRIRIEAVD